MSRISELKPITALDISIPDKSYCALKLRELNAKFIEADQLTKTPEEVAKSILEREGADLTLRERRQLPNLLLQPGFEPFQDAFARAVFNSHAEKNRFWQRLFRAWLALYNPKSKAHSLVLQKLRDNQGKLPDVFLNLIRSYPILQENPDFSGLTKRLLSEAVPAEDRIALGISSEGVVSTRYGSEIMRACAKSVSEGNKTSAQLKAFLKLVAPNGQIDESIKMEAMIGLILGVAKRSPGDDLVKEVGHIIESNFGDPISAKDKWPSVPNDLGGAAARDKCLQTVHQWGVFRAITLFFNIIERVVDPEYRHHFPARRKFWLGYFNSGDITDAWVILGSKAQYEISQLKTDPDSDYAALKYGRLIDARSDQCALLMRLGKTTIMEFSHSGRARMWGEKDFAESWGSKIPVLRQHSYSAHRLRAPCPEAQMFRHYGPWQRRVTSCISALSGKARRI